MDYTLLSGLLLLVIALGIVLALVLWYLRDRAVEWDARKTKLRAAGYACQLDLAIEAEKFGQGPHGPVYARLYEPARTRIANTRANLENAMQQAGMDHAADLARPNSELWKVLPVLQEIMARWTWAQRRDALEKTVDTAQQVISQVRAQYTEILHLGKKTKQRALDARENARALQERSANLKLAPAVLAQAKQQLGAVFVLLDETDKQLAAQEPAEEQVELAVPMLAQVETTLKTIESDLNVQVTVKERADQAIALADGKLQLYKHDLDAEERQGRPFRVWSKHWETGSAKLGTIRAARDNGLYAQAESDAENLLREMGEQHAGLQSVCNARQLVLKHLSTCEQALQPNLTQIQQLPSNHRADLCMATRDAIVALLKQLRALPLSEDPKELEQAAVLKTNILEQNRTLQQDIKSFSQRARECDKQLENLDTEVGLTQSRTVEMIATLRVANARYRTRAMSADLNAAAQVLQTYWDQMGARRAVLLESTLGETERQLQQLHAAHSRLTELYANAETAVTERKQEREQAQSAIQKLSVRLKELGSSRKDSLSFMTGIQDAEKTLKALEVRYVDEATDYALLLRDVNTMLANLDRQEESYKTQLTHAQNEIAASRGRITALLSRLNKLVNDASIDFGLAARASANELTTWQNETARALPNSLDACKKTLEAGKTLENRIGLQIREMEQTREELLRRQEKIETLRKEAFAFEREMQNTLQASSGWNSSHWSNRELADARYDIGQIRELPVSLRPRAAKLSPAAFGQELDRFEADVIRARDAARNAADFASRWDAALRQANRRLEQEYGRAESYLPTGTQAMRDRWSAVVRQVNDYRAQASRANSPENAQRPLADALEAVNGFIREISHSY